MISRAQVARYVADKMTVGRRDAIQKAAAWLVDQRRDGEVHYLANDIARALESKGYTLARVTTASKLDHTTKSQIESFVSEKTGAHQVEIEAAVDEGVIGGVRLRTADSELDATLAHKLAKFVEGVNL